VHWVSNTEEKCENTGSGEILGERKESSHHQSSANQVQEGNLYRSKKKCICVRLDGIRKGEGRFFNLVLGITGEK